MEKNRKIKKARVANLTPGHFEVDKLLIPFLSNVLKTALVELYQGDKSSFLIYVMTS
jgi:hypothetical protein